MNSSTDIDILQRWINDIRVENSDSKRFVPENEFWGVMSEDIITRIIDGLVPAHFKNEIVQFVITGARKVFGVLTMINRIGFISRFIQRDQFQTRCIDSLLPFAKIRLQEILNDDYVAELFYEKQWEFSVPVFSGRIIPRVLDRQTILPYIADNYLAAGSYGSVHKIEIHPSHKPQTMEATTIFVRKELELDDKTYENEVRILSTLQRLNHPNIQRLLGCYTYNSKHNLISPYVAGGSLRKYLEQAKSPALCREEMLCSIAGLASAIWALHEFTLEGGELSNKGTHQDLRPDNILVDGNRFILADFGLSSIKSRDENTKTPFKGRKGYCQAPECVGLGRPYHENQTDRATDIFSLACIMTDLVIYLVNGPSGIQQFHDAREFQIPPMCYYLFHKGGSSNEVVTEWLVEVAANDGSQSMQEVVQLISEMLKITPSARPTAAKVTARLYICIIRAFSEQFSLLFAGFSSSADAIIEHARFSSWELSQDVELYSSSLGATTTGKIFDSTIHILREMKKELENAAENVANRDCRSFLGVRTLNIQLLSMLSPERRASSRSRLESIVLSYIEPDMSGAMYSAMRSAFGDSWVAQKAETKQLVAQVEDPKTPSAIPSFHAISGPITYTQRAGCCKTAKVHSDTHSRSIPVIVETIPYEDHFRAQKLIPRIHALCDLLSSKNLGNQLRVPPFYALYDHVEDFCFEILYEFPTEYGKELSPMKPISLHELLTEQVKSNFPSWESRFQLGLELADSLAAFHDVHWFHKDLTSFNVLFFPTKETAPPARANRPYLTGFRHSRSAMDDFSEGPLQDQKHQRYHHPKYVCVENHHFFRFQPQFDYYSLGILLLEIGFWTSINAIMQDYTRADNYAFSEAMIKQKLPALSFQMGTGYADIVRECLTGYDEQPHNMDTSPASNPTVNDSFMRKVATQLKTLGRVDFTKRSFGKRKREEGENVETPLVSKLKLTKCAH